MESHIEKTVSSVDYELIDSGNGKKLERFGSFILSRPDPEALYPVYDESLWINLDGEFFRKGTHVEWKLKPTVPKSWTIQFSGLSLVIKPTSFKHTGLFPEQSQNWKWMQEKIQAKKSKVKVLNLFAYTGGATLACAQVGAEVCHVDGSKSAVMWAKENAQASGLADAPIRWIVDDCMKFLKREIKRGVKYDAILLDPPSFGHGPKDELWKIEEGFSDLMNLCKEVLSDDRVFVLVNGYASGYSPITYANCLSEIMKDKKGIISFGELVLEESKGKRLLPSGMFARWSFE